MLLFCKFIVVGKKYWLRYSLVILFFGLHFLSFAQLNTAFDPTNPNFSIIHKLFIQHLNQHRKAQGLSPLNTDEVLEAAAKDHSYYQFGLGQLTHIESIPGKKNPDDRVFFHGGNHDQVGENCLFTPVINQEGKGLTCEEIALEMFIQWKNSSSHYNNMIKPNYTLTGLGLVYDNKNKRIFATQLFAQSKYIPVFGNLENTNTSWGVGSYDEAKCTLHQDDEFLASIIGNYLSIRNDSVYIYYRDLEKVRRIISGEKDGFALDILLREQFLCAPSHNLHASPVHDGLMLKPIYKAELFRNNKYGKVNEFLSFLGMLPKEIKGKNFSVSAILIKNGQRCRYTYPISIPEGKLELVDIRPFWLYYEGKVAPCHYVEEFIFKIPFEQGKSEFNQEQLDKALFAVKGYKPFIISAHIKSYASVEGTKQGNLALQQKRANELLHFTKPFLPANAKVNVSGAINYDLFRKQVKGTKWAYLEKLSESEIDKKLKSAKFLDSISRYLPDQRVATITIKVEVDFNENTPVEYLHTGLYYRIMNRDSLEARKIYNKMIRAYEQGKITPNELCRYQIPLDRKLAPLINNYLAAWCLSDSFFTSKPKMDYLMKAIDLLHDSKPFRYNVFLYCLKLWEKQNTLLMEVDALEQYVKNLDPRYFSKEHIDNSLLNFYLLATPYFHNSRKYSQMEYGLGVLKTKLETTSISEKDAIKLAKYFNRYFKFEWSTNVLKRYVLNKPNCSSEAFFTFLKTVTLYRSALNDDQFYMLMKQAPAKNRTEFCKWINESDFQLLRDEKVKLLYCESCK